MRIGNDSAPKIGVRASVRATMRSGPGVVRWDVDDLDHLDRWRRDNNMPRVTVTAMFLVHDGASARPTGGDDQDCD